MRDPIWPVVWREPSGPKHAGSLRLGQSSFTLDGTAAGVRSVIEVAYANVDGLRLDTVGSERLGRRPTLNLRVGRERRFRIAALDGAGAIGELTDALAHELAVA